MELASFTCSICGETSLKICVYCTKDACTNHLCERCLRCSDCCQCDMRRFVENETERVNAAAVTHQVSTVELPEVAEPVEA